MIQVKPIVLFALDKESRRSLSVKHHKMNGVKTMNEERNMIIRRIEKLFNQIWYQLYKAMQEVNLKKIGVEPRKNEATIANYAKKLIYLWNSKNQAINEYTEEFEAIEKEQNMLLNIESEVKKLDDKINKVKFLDEIKTNDNIFDTDSREIYTSKYRRMVLDLLSTCENQQIIQIQPRQPVGQKVGMRAARNSTAFYDQKTFRRAGLLTQNLKVANQKYDNQTGKRCETAIVNSNEKVKPLFGEEFLSKTTDQTFLTRQKSFTSNNLKICPTSAQGINFLLSRHARSKTPRNSCNHEKVEQEENFASKIASHIFGKKTESVFQRCLTQAKLDMAKKAKLNKSKSMVRKSTKKVIKLEALFETCDTMKNLTVVPPKKKESKSDNLFTKCENQKNAAENDLIYIKKAHDNFNIDLNSLKELSKRNENKNNLMEEKKSAKFLIDHKHLFIYGKNGLGRYLNAKAKDMIKISDLVLKLKPEYPFLANRLNDIIIKDI